MITIESLNKSLTSFFSLESKQEKALYASYCKLVKDFREWIGKSPKLSDFREQWQKMMEAQGKEKDSRFNFTALLRIAYAAENGVNLQKFTSISSLIEATAILKHSGVKTGPDSLVFSGPPEAVRLIEESSGKSVKAIREERKNASPKAKAENPEKADPETENTDQKSENLPTKDPEKIAKMISSYLEDEDVLVAFCLESVRLNRHIKIASRLTEVGKVTGTKLPEIAK